EGGEDARRQALEVGEVPFQADEAQEGDPERHGEHGAPGVATRTQPPGENAEEQRDLGEEEEIGEALHLYRALKPRSAAAHSPAVLPNTEPAISPAPPGGLWEKSRPTSSPHAESPAMGRSSKSCTCARRSTRSPPKVKVMPHVTPKPT